MELFNLKHSELRLDVNAYKIPVTQYQMTTENARKFNEIYEYVRNIKGIERIKRTNSGGISIARKNLVFPSYDVRASNCCVELTVLLEEGMWRIQFRDLSPKANDEDEDPITGHKAFSIFRKELKKDGINIDDYAITNGAEVKKEIEKPLIRFGIDVSDIVWDDNVHHIDFHNSYPAGLCNTHEEFRKTVTRLYERRKEDDKKNNIYKQVLNLTTGYLQSIGCCGARWAHLSRDAIKNNNDRIRDLSKRLEESGRLILLYNTDGIWYYGDEYHGEGEGEALGEWENDHINCKFRAKSAGCYEYIENGAYTPVVRGKTKLDRIKKRRDWEWGDIYRNDCKVLKFRFTELGGIECYED